MGRDEAIDWLVRSGRPDGSWGYLVGQPGRAEPTVLAAAAVRAAGRAPASGFEATSRWLTSTDLGYSELLLPAALARVAEARALIDTCLEGLLAWEPVRMDVDPTIMGHDGQLAGWPWQDGTSSWVEPTSYALLSLGRWGRGDHPRAREARAMLRNRVCYDGGWNYGNTRVYDMAIESEPVSTAWATMALGDDPLVERALDTLRGFVRQEPSTLNSSLTLLALTARALPADEFVPALLARQLPDGSFRGRVELTALAALALGALEDRDHVFALAT